MKVQYPGVATSIESDLSNLQRIFTLTNLFPPGLFVDRIVEVAKDELVQECNYELEVGATFIGLFFPYHTHTHSLSLSLSNVQRNTIHTWSRLNIRSDSLHLFQTIQS